MNQPTSPPPTPGWQPRFSLFTMMLITVLVCILAAGAGYLVRALQRDDGSSQSTFVIFIVAAPVVVVVILAACWQIYAYASGQQPDDGDDS